MLKLTRRVLIKQASIGAGAVSLLAATVAAKTHFRTSPTTSTKVTEQSGLASGEALVVYITDPGTGTLTVMRGERETTVNSVALVQHLLSL